jgi:hypothetical protein
LNLKCVLLGFKVCFKNHQRVPLHDGIVGLAPSKVEKGVVGRLKQVAHILDHVHGGAVKVEPS